MFKVNWLWLDGNMIHAKATNDKKLKLKERRMFSGAVTYSMIQDDHLPFYNLGIRFGLLIRIEKYLMNWVFLENNDDLWSNQCFQENLTHDRKSFSISVAHTKRSLQYTIFFDSTSHHLNDCKAIFSQTMLQRCIILPSNRWQSNLKDENYLVETFEIWVILESQFSNPNCFS